MTVIDLPKPKRKYTRHKPVAPKATSELSGLSATDCCSACNATRCIISGKSYCAHPFKGGLQGIDMADDAATARLNAAKKSLGKSKVKIGNQDSK